MATQAENAHSQAGRPAWQFLRDRDEGQQGSQGGQDLMPPCPKWLLGQRLEHGYSDFYPEELCDLGESLALSGLQCSYRNQRV